jgi:hypothetical protein
LKTSQPSFVTSNRPTASTYEFHTFEGFAKNTQPISDKVSRHHYHYLFNELITPTSKKIKLLEIGLGCNMNYGPGASAQIWRQMFPNADIYFVEYDENCVRKWQSHITSLNIQVFIGSQSDIVLLKQVIANGPYDIIIDDGGHSDRQMLTSLFTLIEANSVAQGGLYIVEDMACNHETSAIARQRYRDNVGVDYTAKGIPGYLINAPINKDGSLRPFTVFQMWIEQLSAEVEAKPTLATKNFNYVGCASGVCFIRFLKTSQPSFFFRLTYRYKHKIRQPPCTQRQVAQLKNYLPQKKFLTHVLHR